MVDLVAHIVLIIALLLSAAPYIIGMVVLYYLLKMAVILLEALFSRLR